MSKTIKLHIDPSEFRWSDKVMVKTI